MLKTCVFPINHALFNILYESLNFHILIPRLYIILVIKNLCGFNIFHKNEHSHIITLNQHCYRNGPYTVFVVN